MIADCLAIARFLIHRPQSELPVQYGLRLRRLRVGTVPSVFFPSLAFRAFRSRFPTRARASGSSTKTSITPIAPRSAPSEIFPSCFMGVGPINLFT